MTLIKRLRKRICPIINEEKLLPQKNPWLQFGIVNPWYYLWTVSGNNQIFPKYRTINNTNMDKKQEEKQAIRGILLVALFAGLGLLFMIYLNS